VNQKTMLARHEGGMRFTVSTGSGHEIVLDDGISDAGPRPTEALLAALVACTAMDVASLLTKKRQVVTSYTVEASGEQQEAHPQVFTRIDIVHVVEGPSVDETAVRRSIELSASRYCPINAMVSAGPTEVHHRYRLRLIALEPALVVEGEAIVTGPNMRAEVTS
jgi:putative redox protein